jgi:hypothetical protein
MARTTLGWEPNVALEQGLLRTIAYFERLLALNTDARVDGPLPASVV